MPKVKIFLNKNETPEDAKELLLKALQSSVPEGHKEAFHDPAAQDVFTKMIKNHEKMWEQILKEVSQLLDEEVK